jgi:hypothetical protein
LAQLVQRNFGTIFITLLSSHELTNLLCGGIHLGILMHIKNINFTIDCPMFIHIQVCSFYKNAFDFTKLCHEVVASCISNLQMSLCLLKLGLILLFGSADPKEFWNYFHHFAIFSWAIRPMTRSLSKMFLWWVGVF